MSCVNSWFDIQLLVGSAFKTKSEAGNSEHDQYACAGTAAVLIYRQDSRVKSVLDIAKEALKQCPAIFAVSIIQ